MRPTARAAWFGGDELVGVGHARSFMKASCDSASQTLFTRPMASACSIVTLVPSTISSMARALSDDARQALGAAGAGQHAEGDLGQADLDRPLARDAQVARERDLEAAAHGVAVERGDDELRRLLEAQQRLVGVEAEVVLERLVRLFEHVDVGAGAEELLAVAGDDEDVDVVVEARLEDGGVELLHHLVGVGVARAGRSA